MRFIAFKNKDNQPSVGVKLDNEVVDITKLGFPDSLDKLIAFDRNILKDINSAIVKAKNRLNIDELKFLPPILAPSKAIAVGLNYIDHASEGNMPKPDYPVLFNRYPSSWVPHKEPLIKPLLSDQYDYEGELVVVIGKKGRYINRNEALNYIAGYSIFNDGSVRDYQFKSSQWMMGKNFDLSGSFGPEFVTADELPEGAKGLNLKTRLNGKTMQNANTRDMIFDVATLVSICSEPFMLNPGDIIITGTPAGVGAARKPPVFMKEGDFCEVEIEGIGILSNKVVNEK